MPRGGKRIGAGRKPLAEGEKRVTIWLTKDGEHLSLSTLECQREYLRALGEGNISEGFRRILGAVEELSAYRPQLIAAVLCTTMGSDLARDVTTVHDLIDSLVIEGDDGYGSVPPTD